MRILMLASLTFYVFWVAVYAPATHREWVYEQLETSVD